MRSRFGDLFMGAGPAVDAAGFVTFSPAWRLFRRLVLACLLAKRHHRSRGADHTGSLEKALGMSTVGDVLDRLATDIEHGCGTRRCSSIADQSRLGSI